MPDFDLDQALDHAAQNPLCTRWKATVVIKLPDVCAQNVPDALAAWVGSLNGRSARSEKQGVTVQFRLEPVPNPPAGVLAYNLCFDCMWRSPVDQTAARAVVTSLVHNPVLREMPTEIRGHMPQLSFGHLEAEA